jgi:hypothetical protein
LAKQLRILFLLLGLLVALPYCRKFLTLPCQKFIALARRRFLAFLSEMRLVRNSFPCRRFIALSSLDLSEITCLALSEITYLAPCLAFLSEHDDVLYFVVLFIYISLYNNVVFINELYILLFIIY